MKDKEILEVTNTLLSKFIINVKQIQRNSDHELEDIKNESVIVVMEFYPQIQKDERVFINELKKRCLKFNKYNRRIESKDRWERFNIYEERLSDMFDPIYSYDEDAMCSLLDIENIVGSEQYDFLIDYYSLGADTLAKQQNTTPSNIRRKVKKLIDFIKEKYKEVI